MDTNPNTSGEHIRLAMALDAEKIIADLETISSSYYSGNSSLTQDQNTSILVILEALKKDFAKSPD